MVVLNIREIMTNVNDECQMKDLFVIAGLAYIFLKASKKEKSSRV